MGLEFLELLIGFVLGVILDWWGRPAFSRLLESIVLNRAKARYKAARTPNPPQEFKYRLGNIEIPVKNLFGSPETPFELDDAIIEYKPQMDCQQPDYPRELSDAKPYLEQVSSQIQGKSWSDTALPRLAGYKPPYETQEDTHGRFTLRFTLTTFSTLLATNSALDYAVIPESGPMNRFIANQTIRDAYVSLPYDLETSTLANPLCVTVVVISRNLNQFPREQVLIRRRSQQVYAYRGFYQTSAAGFLSLAHRDESGLPNPFVTAVEEARQEIADGLRLSPSDFKLIGMAVSWQEMVPFVYGYVETGYSVEELLGDFCRDGWEGTPEALSFQPEAVLSHISQHRWEPLSAVAMCATLLAHFSRDVVEAAARRIPAKNARDFFKDG